MHIKKIKHWCYWLRNVQQQTTQPWFGHSHLNGMGPGRAATNTFLFFLTEWAISLCKSTERYISCGFGGGFVRILGFYDRIYQAEDGNCPDRWHHSERPWFPAIVLLSLYLSAITAVHCLTVSVTICKCTACLCQACLYVSVDICTVCCICLCVSR